MATIRNHSEMGTWAATPPAMARSTKPDATAGQVEDRLVLQLQRVGELHGDVGGDDHRQTPAHEGGCADPNASREAPTATPNGRGIAPLAIGRYCLAG